jgi:hypothetical protein
MASDLGGRESIDHPLGFVGLEQVAALGKDQAGGVVSLGVKEGQQRADMRRRFAQLALLGLDLAQGCDVGAQASRPLSVAGLRQIGGMLLGGGEEGVLQLERDLAPERRQLLVGGIG